MGIFEKESIKTENYINALDNAIIIYCETTDNPDTEKANEGFFKKLIKVFKEFIDKIKDGIKALFSKLFKKINLDKALEHLDDISDEQKLKLGLIDRETLRKNIMNDYLKEMATAIRKLDKLYVKNSYMKDNSLKSSVEANKISQEIEEIDKKYNDKLDDMDKETVKKAVKQSVKISSKQIKDLQLNFDNIENDYKDIIKVVEDESKKKPTGIAKVYRSIATKITQTMRKITYTSASNIKLIVGAIAAVGGLYYTGKKAKGYIDGGMEAMVKDAVRKKVDAGFVPKS